MDAEINHIRAGYARMRAGYKILQAKFDKLKALTVSSLESLDVEDGEGMEEGERNDEGEQDVEVRQDGAAHPRVKHYATARRQHRGLDATAEARAFKRHVMQALIEFETELKGFRDKFGEERMSDSHQTEPNPANDNTTPASDPPDPNAVVYFVTEEVDTSIHPDDCDMADKPRTATPEKTEEPDTSEDDASQDTASSDPPTPPFLLVDCSTADEDQIGGRRVSDSPEDSVSSDPEDQSRVRGRNSEDSGSPDGRDQIRAQSVSYNLEDELCVYRGPVETPTCKELDSFSSFYRRSSQLYSSDGFVPFKVPTAYLGTRSTPTKPLLPAYYIQTLEWKSTLIAEVSQVLSKPPDEVEWQIHNPPEQDSNSALSAFSTWLAMSRQSATYSLPHYATNIDVVESEDRTRVCLPEKSAVYPLEGNLLLSSAPTTPGITTPEAFCSKGFGTVFTLHIEDFEAPSLNVNHYGSEKLWIIIPQKEYQKLEAALCRDGFGGGQSVCHQWIRHLTLFLHPTYLQQNNIRYSCFLQSPGIGILIFPGAAHYGLNLGPNLAEAVNYVPDGWVPRNLKPCSCNGPALTRGMFLATTTDKTTASSKRKPPFQSTNASKRTKCETRLQQPPDDNATSWLRYIASEDSKLPELVDGTTSAGSIRRFMNIIRAWRGKGGNVCTQLRDINKHNEPQRKIKSLDELMVACQDRSELFSLLEVLTSVRLYRNLSRDASRRISTRAIDQLLEIRGLDASKRTTVSNELGRYQKWDRFCSDKCEGILCFFPPALKDNETMTRRDVHRMGNADIEKFCSRLLNVEYVKRLCQVGKAFERGVFGEEEFGKRPFEKYEGDLDMLEVEELLELL